MDDAVAVEVNLDGLVGPTHNFGGLSYGNVASIRSRAARSSPRDAALEGLAKMRVLCELGVPQAVLPPHPRPDVDALRRLGFAGDDARVLAHAAREAPDLLVACSSASAMWAANAATVCPAPDAADGRLHVTPANLTATMHRSLEPPVTSRVLRAAFPDEALFTHHPPLPCTGALDDEGAANHTRLCADHGGPGVQLFVYGRRALGRMGRVPRRFPARQTREASEAVARRHAVAPDRLVLARESPEAIDAGAFHADVVLVGHRDVLLHHELAFADEPRVIAELQDAVRRVAGVELRVVKVPAAELSLEQAVATYLFNSQLVTAADGALVVVAPAECAGQPQAAALLERLVADPASPVDRVRLVEVRESMRNGGGPACLRLRVVLTAAQRAAMAPGVLLDPAGCDRLAGWVRRHYRDRLDPEDLADPALLDESRRALDELTALLGLGAVYTFQQ